MDSVGRKIYSPLLKEEQFYKHFFIAPRMELFAPCDVRCNQSYTYHVRQLTDEELYQINSMLLDMETEEFVFHDRDKIKKSLDYYDNKAVFVDKKKHDFSMLINSY